jgi:hypothetical protein
VTNQRQSRLVIPLQCIGNAGINAFVAIYTLFRIQLDSTTIARYRRSSRAGTRTIRIKTAIARTNGKSTFGSGIILYSQRCLFDSHGFKPRSAAGKHAAVASDTLLSGNNS